MLPPGELSKAEMAREGLTRAQMANAEMAKQQGRNHLATMDVAAPNMARDKQDITSAAYMATGGLGASGKNFKSRWLVLN